MEVGYLDVYSLRHLLNKQYVTPLIYLEHVLKIVKKQTEEDFDDMREILSKVDSKLAMQNNQPFVFDHDDF